ncbi:MAG: hypothetical protein AAF411_16630 [Myxococcota bacterium]
MDVKPLQLDEPIRTDLRAAAVSALEAAKAAAALAEREPRAKLFSMAGSAARRRADEVRLLHQGAYDALTHVSQMVGYLDGYEARTRTRKRLQDGLARPERRSAREGLEALAESAERVGRELETLARRSEPGVALAGPRRPGPKRTAQVAREHLDALRERVAAFMKLEAAK